MRRAFTLAVFLTSWCAMADVTRLESIAELRKPSDHEFSCRVLHRRLRHFAKAHAGIAGLLQKLRNKRSWNRNDFERLESVMATTRAFPESYYTRTWVVVLTWKVTEEWRAILNSPDALAVRWQFKGRDWFDGNGTLPDEVLSIWNGEEGTLNVSVKASPVEVCTGDEDLKLTILKTGAEDVALDLQSRVEEL